MVASSNLMRRPSAAAALLDIAGMKALLGKLDFMQRIARGAQGLWGAGVLEVVEDDVGTTYRAVYTVKFNEALFVLHFSKKRVSAASPRQKKTWTLLTLG